MRKSVDKTEAECDQITDRADQINEKVDKEMMPKITELQKIHSQDFEDIHVTCKSSLLRVLRKHRSIYSFFFSKMQKIYY